MLLYTGLVIDVLPTECFIACLNISYFKETRIVLVLFVHFLDKALQRGPELHIKNIISNHCGVIVEKHYKNTSLGQYRSETNLSNGHRGPSHHSLENQALKDQSIRLLKLFTSCENAIYSF